MLRQLLSNGGTGVVGNIKQEMCHHNNNHPECPSAVIMTQAHPNPVAGSIIVSSSPTNNPSDMMFIKNEPVLCTLPPADPHPPHPGEVVVKNEDGEKSLAVLSNMPPVIYYPHPQSAPPMVMRYPGEEFNGHISGTTELFSSTFAMLSADGVIPESDWSSQQEYGPKIENMDTMYNVQFADSQMQIDEFGQSYSQQPVQIIQQPYQEIQRYEQGYGQCVDRPSVSDQPQMLQQTVYYPSSQIIISSDIPQTSSASPSSSHNVKKSTAKSGRATQSAFSHAFREMSQIPVSTASGRNTPSAENENETDERVMCMACRGVYPSRRSLTGHIGRNEKCREIIGRNYLDQLGGTVDKVSTSIGHNGSLTPGDTLSPICPYCDRFISHYKGNIRRHINQCLKSKPRAKKSNSRRKPAETSSSTPMTPVGHFGDGSLTPNGSSNSNDAFYDSYQPHALSVPSGDQQWANGTTSTNGLTVNQPSSLRPSSRNDGKNNDDPYLCPLCDFVTVYKGNMKRHLSTCHTLNEEDLQDGGLDSLRASRCPNNLESRIGKVTRGRRPKSAQANEDSRKRLKLALVDRTSPSDLDGSSNPNEQSESTSSMISSTSNGNNESSMEASVMQTNVESCSGYILQSNDDASRGSDYNSVTDDNSSIYIDQQNNCDVNPSTSCNSFSSNENGHTDTQSEDNIITSGPKCSSNIDEIINAVASNQLGSSLKKPLKQQGKVARGGSRRNHVPKTVRNMEEVRGYWEAERLNSGSASLPPTYFARSRVTQFTTVPSQLATGATSSTSQQ